ncbi:molybdenum ABC transporter ATP-binding protein [Methylophaga nitratireducenticrescens]|uniref:ABC-type tungstate transport system, ATP-binding protein n=1 Tax=Methylophaga nitratireducenticrescens TaxID=754476 RepID=I1XLP5_METNJ|nr:ATP-binding cassette domain-containing protein [Methylophaga nitratireducenticrescens]AFI85314.1 molybdenum ABC transporter ATP-binding protein [Methylophaga nitratireducenticrescens]
MTYAYQLNNVKVHYHDQLVLDIEKLNIPAYECLAVLGENGAGKSTLFHLLSLLQKPDSGDISVLDNEINASQTKQCHQIGLVPQHPYMLPGTVTDNIRLALKLKKVDKARHASQLQQALETVNLTHLADQTANTLSGGEQRRVAIARVLAFDPKILLLDEPFANLDSFHQRQLEDVITMLANDSKRTILFSTHDRLQASAITPHTIQLLKGKPISAPLLNLFHGHYDGELFHTKTLKIFAAEGSLSARHIAIDPLAITISTHAHSDSSARNQLPGRLISISEADRAVRLTVDCGDKFEVIISQQALSALALSLGASVWISFKATAVTLL